MFRLVNYNDNDEVTDLYRYLSSTASKVIYNALDVWAGTDLDILHIYLTEFEGYPAGEQETDFFDHISEYISPSIVRPEINSLADRMKIGHTGISDDGRIGMELLTRKISRMKEKMADPDHYYTFDLFEEFLFAKMISSYEPGLFNSSEDPYIITTDEEVKAAAEKLFTEYKVGEELEASIGEEGIGKEYADYLARTIHRIDQMDLWASEEAGFESLFFWNLDYEIVFEESFVRGIKDLVGGAASVMGYGYKDVEAIFTDAGIKAPLTLVGTETAFDTVGQMAQEKLAEIMKSMPDMDSTPEEFIKWMEQNGLSDDDLPFS